MFTPGGARLGAGSGLPKGSYDRPDTAMEVISGGLVSPDARDSVRTNLSAALTAVQAFQPAFIVGAGCAPPAGFIGPFPPYDSARRAFGSGEGYNSWYDVTGDYDGLTVSKIVKGFRKSNLLGATAVEETPAKLINSADFSNLMRNLLTVVRNKLPLCYYGGTWVDFMADPTFDPVIVAGSSYFPDTTVDTWVAFTATADTVVRFEARKTILRQHVADVFLALCEPTHWAKVIVQRAGLESSVSSNGQKLVTAAFDLFSFESTKAIIDRAESLRKPHHYVRDAENPTKKLEAVLEEFAALRLTTFGVTNYGDVWLSQTFSGMLKDNSCWRTWRLNDGDTKLLGMTSSQMVPHLVDYYQANHGDFKAIVKESDGNRKAREGFARNGTGNGKSRQSTGSDGKDLSHIKCFKCGQMGHYANRCKNKRVGGGKGGRKGGGGAGKGGKGGKERTSDWTKAPCIFKQCSGDRSTHAASDCPDKIANDKRSAQTRTDKEKLENVTAQVRKVTFKRAGSSGSGNPKTKVARQTTVDAQEASPPSRRMARTDSFDESDSDS